ncbi:MAG: anthranilate synthase component I family protein [Planctomycetota bacterium]
MMQTIRWQSLRRTRPADLDTPVSAFLKLRPLGANFLLETVERGAVLGRYSFIGLHPLFEYRVASERPEIVRPGKTAVALPTAPDPLASLRAYLRSSELEGAEPDLALLAGAVGHIGYDYVRSIERLAPARPARVDFPLARFTIPGSLVIFDHLTRRLSVVTVACAGRGRSVTAADGIAALLDELAADPPPRAEARLDAVLAALDRPLPAAVPRALPARQFRGEASVSPQAFAATVRQAKAHIQRGDIFQVVLSQSQVGMLAPDPFEVYRALRMLNPSPYMFFLDAGLQTIVGSSPEVLVKLEQGVATVRPIAGTRPRHGDPDRDRALERELLGDEKETAEHVMLVDLGRNDLGRVCEFGSVKATDLMTVERYSHVMHLVSYVRGRLRADQDCFDLLRASFPAGTVSGAPKVRAMQIIDDLEAQGRGPYAGALGYFGIGGDMDLCITIRTIFVDRGKALLQAGAGIVADSDPDREHQECRDKMAALERAIATAEEGLR